MKMKDKKLLGNGLLLFTALIWGTAFVFQREGMEKIEPISFNAARMVLAAAVVGIVAFILWKKEKKGTDRLEAGERKKYNRYTVTGGIMFAAIVIVQGD